MRFSKTWRYLRLQIFLSREGKIVYLYLKNNWNSNFTKLSTAETKILTTSQTKNAQARRTSSFGIFTSPRPILLASGTGPPTNFEDWQGCDFWQCGQKKIVYADILYFVEHVFSWNVACERGKPPEGAIASFYSTSPRFLCRLTAFIKLL
jgi:hypothetical protein